MIRNYFSKQNSSFFSMTDKIGEEKRYLSASPSPQKRGGDNESSILKVAAHAYVKRDILNICLTATKPQANCYLLQPKKFILFDKKQEKIGYSSVQLKRWLLFYTYKRMFRMCLKRSSFIHFCIELFFPNTRMPQHINVASHK